MPGRSCYFFAGNDDLLHLLDAFNVLGEYKYVQIRSGLDSPNLVFTNPVDCFSLAVATPARPEKSQSFLILESDQEVFARDVERSDGSGTISVADQNNNFDSVVFALGGEVGDQTLVISDINTVGDTDKAVKMHETFKKLVMSKTKRAGAKGNPYRLMPGAIEKLRCGWRLAMGKSWSRDTDAKISAEEITTL